MFSAHDDEIDVLIRPLVTRQSADRADTGVKVELLPQPDIDRPVAFADGGRARSFKGDAVLANRVQRGIGQRIAKAFDSAQTGGRLDPINPSTGSPEDCVRGSHHFRTDAVAGDFYDGSHSGEL